MAKKFVKKFVKFQLFSKLDICKRKKSKEHRRNADALDCWAGDGTRTRGTGWEAWALPLGDARNSFAD